MDANLAYVDAADRLLGKLVDVEEPEAKRKIIGAEFIRVVEEEARKVGNEVSFLAQGTIYHDILESQDGVKAHRNVGGLPENMVERHHSPVRVWVSAAWAPSPATALKYVALGTRTRGRNYNQAGSRRDIGKNACNFFFPIKINNPNPCTNPGI